MGGCWKKNDNINSCKGKSNINCNLPPKKQDGSRDTWIFKDANTYEILNNAAFLKHKVTGSSDADKLCKQSGYVGALSKLKYYNYVKDLCPDEAQTCWIGDAWWASDKSGKCVYKPNASPTCQSVGCDGITIKSNCELESFDACCEWNTKYPDTDKPTYYAPAEYNQSNACGSESVCKSEGQWLSASGEIEGLGYPVCETTEGGATRLGKKECPKVCPHPENF